jgi:hypothetical protein
MTLKMFSFMPLVKQLNTKVTTFTMIFDETDLFTLVKLWVTSGVPIKCKPLKNATKRTLRAPEMTRQGNSVTPHIQTMRVQCKYQMWFVGAIFKISLSM